VDTWHWRLIMLGKIRTQENLSSELEHMDAQLARIRNSVASDLLGARGKLHDITPDFPATIVIGRRASLTDYDIKAFRDYNDSAHEVEVRTYDWLVESAVPTGWSLAQVQGRCRDLARPATVGAGQTDAVLGHGVLRALIPEPFVVVVANGERELDRGGNLFSTEIRIQRYGASSRAQLLE
jgi:hypothetical protein